MVVVVAVVARILLQLLPVAAAGPIVRVSAPVVPAVPVLVPVPVPVLVAVAVVTTAAVVPADPDPGTVVAAVAVVVVAFDLLAAGAGPAVDGQTYWYRQRPSRLIAYYPLTVLLAAAEAETDPVGG